MKLVFKIKTEPVPKATIIIVVVTFASGSLATIAIYVNSPIAGIICAIILVIIVYHLAFCLTPR
jgi:hypothetical protein